MKKWIFLSLATVFSSATAHAYDHYESSGSGFMTFIGIILLVWGVLEVILFFKIWKMTDDVKSLKKSLVDGKLSSDVSSMTLGELKKSVRKKYYLGHIDEAENEISMFAYKKLMRLEGRVLQFDDKGGRFVWIPMRGGELKRCDPDVFIQAVIDEASSVYQAIGRDVPATLKNLTYDEFVSFADKAARGTSETAENQEPKSRVELTCPHCNTRLLVHNTANVDTVNINCPKCGESVEVKF